MMESLAMCIFLGDAFPEKGLAPAPDSPWRAAYLQWLVYGTATLEPVLSPPFIRSLSVPLAERQTVATDDERRRCNVSWNRYLFTTDAPTCSENPSPLRMWLSGVN